MNLTPEMIAWLSTSRSDYEFYLLHKMLHDRGERINMLGVAKLTANDFVGEEHAAILQAMDNLTKIENRTNVIRPSPIDAETMRTHIAVAVSLLDLAPDVKARAHALVQVMQNPTFAEQWHCIPLYLEAWLTTVRAKRTARKVQIAPVIDAGDVVRQLTQAQDQASRAIYRPEDDDMNVLFDSQDEDQLRRVSTGIAPLDRCLNGGLGAGECYMVFSGTGGGKCHSKGTKILMYSGCVKKVEDVVVGDLVMGPDSNPRRVVSLARGRDQMFDIVPHRGAAVTGVNLGHILTLQVTNIGSRVVRSADGVEARAGAWVDVTLDDYLRSSAKFRHVTKWVQSAGVEFPDTGRALEIHPYLLGFWLGYGTCRNTQITKPGVAAAVRDLVEGHGWTLNEDLVRNDSDCETVSVLGGMRDALKKLNLLRNKHVPQHYLTASAADRALLLAGLIDSGGSVHRAGWEFSNTSRNLIDAVVFLSRSLGHSCSEPAARVTYSQHGTRCDSWRIHISATSQVPTRIKHAPLRRQVKNPLTNGFKVVPLGEGDYYGFNLSGADRRYLLGDFSVTHNSILIGQISWHLAEVERDPNLIVSTELHARDYLVRTVANAAHIKIYLIQDCMNAHQIRMVVQNTPELRQKAERVDEVLETFRKLIRVVKVDAEQGLRAGDILQREYDRFTDLHGRKPGVVGLDWIGTTADAESTGGASSSDRATQWERSSNSCVSFADRNDTATVVLAQAMNDSERKGYLVRADLAISKAMMNNMTAGIGLTNQIDAAALAADAANTDPDRQAVKRYFDGQRLCLVKARKGEGLNIPVQRDFLYQRLVSPRR